MAVRIPSQTSITGRLDFGRLGGGLPRTTWPGPSVNGFRQPGRFQLRKRGATRVSRPNEILQVYYISIPYGIPQKVAGICLAEVLERFEQVLDLVRPLVYAAVGLDERLERELGRPAARLHTSARTAFSRCRFQHARAVPPPTGAGSGWSVSSSVRAGIVEHPPFAQRVVD